MECLDFCLEFCLWKTKFIIRAVYCMAPDPKIHVTSLIIAALHVTTIVHKESWTNSKLVSSLSKQIVFAPDEEIEEWRLYRMFVYNKFFSATGVE